MNVHDFPITVRIFAPPIVACNQGATWKAAADRIGRRLQERYADKMRVDFIELFSPESFDYPEILALVEQGEPAPFVKVNDAVIQRGGKLSEALIRTELERLLA